MLFDSPLLQFDKNLAFIPIVALTAHLPEETLERECFLAGMNYFLTKPLTLQNATDIINKFVAKKNSANHIKLLNCH